MKKKLLSTILAGLTAANISGMDLPDNNIASKFILHGAYTELDIFSFMDKLPLKKWRTISQINTNKSKEIQGLFESRAKLYFSEGLQLLRKQANYAEQWTIKKLHDSIYHFFKDNGLSDFFDSLSLKNIEVLNIDFAQKIDNFEANYSLEKQDILEAKDYKSGVNLLRDYRFFDVKIGTNEENRSRIHAICDFDKDSNLSQISLYNTLEGYDSIFAHESGHAYQHFVYPELYAKRYDVLQQTGRENDVLYLSSEIIAWMFEFRYLIEKQTLNKGDIAVLGTVLPKILYDTTPTISYYFTNYALSMAGQTDKPLKDLANLAVSDIENNIVPYFTYIPEKRCFSGIPNESKGQYGIDKNLAVKFNAEKNKSILSKLLTKMGYDSSTIINKTSSIVQEEHREFINAVLAMEN